MNMVIYTPGIANHCNNCADCFKISQKLKYRNWEGTKFVLSNIVGDDLGDCYEPFQSIFTDLAWRG